MCARLALERCDACERAPLRAVVNKGLDLHDARPGGAHPKFQPELDAPNRSAVDHEA